jgi:hypothetical protein
MRSRRPGGDNRGMHLFVFAAGAALAAIGLANLGSLVGTIPVFPSANVCTNVSYDLFACQIEVWWGAPWAVFAGVVVMALGVWLGRRTRRALPWPCRK